MNLAKPAALLAATIFVAGTAQAQTKLSIGPRLGLNINNISLEGSNLYDIKPNSMAGVQVGAQLDARFGNLSVQPALLFSRKGFKLDKTRTQRDGSDVYNINAKATVGLNYLEVPINLVYNAGEENAFQVFAGPYLGFLLGGSTEVSVLVKEAATGADVYRDSGTGTVKAGDKQPDNSSTFGSANNPGSSSENEFYVRGFDAGFQAGVGYRFGPVQAQVGYQLGLSNIVPTDADGTDLGYTAKNRGFQVAVSYLFSK